MSQKEKENVARNLCLHRLSCGRYDNLKDIMIFKKRKQRQQEL